MELGGMFGVLWRDVDYDKQARQLATLDSLKKGGTLDIIFEIYMGVSKNRGGPPEWMVKIMRKPY